MRRSTRLLTVVVAAAAFVLCSAAAAQADCGDNGHIYSWADNVSGSWSDAGNWDEDGLPAATPPGPNDAVDILQGTVTLDSGPVTVDCLAVQSTLLVDGTLNVSTSLGVSSGSVLVANASSPVTMGQNATLEIVGTLTEGDGLELTGGDTLKLDAGGTLNGSGTLTLTDGGAQANTIDVTGGSQTIGTPTILGSIDNIELGGGLTFSNTVEVGTGSAISVSGAGHMLTVTAPVSPSDATNPEGINDHGVNIKFAAPLALNGGALTDDGTGGTYTFAGTGPIDVNMTSGHFEVSGGVALAASTTVGTDATLQFDGGSSFGSGSSYTLTNNGTIDTDGTGGTASVPTTLVSNAGTVDANGDIIDFLFVGTGVIDGSNDLLGNVWETSGNGSIEFPGTINQIGDGTNATIVSLSGSKAAANGGQFGLSTNAPTTNALAPLQAVAAGSSLSIGGALTESWLPVSGTFTVGPGATLALGSGSADQQVNIEDTVHGTLLDLDNEGTVTLTGNTASIWLGGIYTNEGSAQTTIAGYADTITAGSFVQTGSAGTTFEDVGDGPGIVAGTSGSAGMGSVQLSGGTVTYAAAAQNEGFWGNVTNSGAVIDLTAPGYHDFESTSYTQTAGAVKLGLDAGGMKASELSTITGGIDLEGGSFDVDGSSLTNPVDYTKTYTVASAKTTLTVGSGVTFTDPVFPANVGDQYAQVARNIGASTLTYTLTDSNPNPPASGGGSTDTNPGGQSTTQPQTQPSTSSTTPVTHPLGKIKVTVAKNTTLTSVLTGGLGVTLACNQSCKVTGRLTITAKLAKQLGLLAKKSKSRTAVVIGTGTAKIGKAGRVTLKLKLTVKARHAFSKLKSVSVAELFTVTGANRKATTVKGTLVLHAAKRKATKHTTR